MGFMTSNQNVRQYCLPLVSSLALSFDTDPLSAMILDSGASSGKLLAFGTRAVNETLRNFTMSGEGRYSLLRAPTGAVI